MASRRRQWACLLLTRTLTGTYGRAYLRPPVGMSVGDWRGEAPGRVSDLRMT